MRKRLGTASVALVATALLAGCASGPAEPTDTTLVIGDASGDAPNWDPLAGAAPSGFMVSAVYEGLFSINNTSGSGEPEPMLATGYEWNEDRTTVSITLRDDATFSDGTPFDAEAVKANLDYVQEFGQDHWSYAYVAQVTEIEITGDYGLDITLAQPDPYFLKLQGSRPMISPAALEHADSLTVPVGTGPYVLDEDASVSGSEYVFTKRDDYWDADAVPYDTLIVKLLPDVTARVNALKTGQIDFAQVDTGTAVEVEDAGFTVDVVPWIWVGLGLDPRPGAVTADVRVRQALSYAIDRASIFENVERGYGLGGDQVWVEGQPFFRPDRVGEYDYDPEKARELLAEAGYPDGFALTIPTFSGWLLEPYQPAIQQNLADIGVEVTWNLTTAEETVASWNGDLDLPVVTFLEAFPLVLPQVVYPTGVHNNHQRWGTDATATELIHTIVTGDEEAADAASAELGDYVLDQAWFVVVGQPTILYAHSDGIESSDPLSGMRGIRPVS